MGRIAQRSQLIKSELTTAGASGKRYQNFGQIFRKRRVVPIKRAMRASALRSKNSRYESENLAKVEAMYPVPTGYSIAFVGSW
jgi:hypothetical protein